MKKGLCIAGECLLLIIVLVVIKGLLGHFIPGAAESWVLQYALYVLSGLGCILIYRWNTRKTEGNK